MFSTKTTAATKHQDDDDDDNDNNDSQFTKFYQINGVGEKSRVTMTTNTGHSLSTDVPINMGGTDTAPQPVETLLAALLGCTQATAVFVGRNMKLPNRSSILIDRLEFRNVTATRDERGALTLPIESDPVISARLERISGTIHVYTKSRKGESSLPLSQEELDILSHQTELRCPVANMIMASGCEMNIQWINGNTTQKSRMSE
jgi:uncharacterized OsmC-like protein